MKEIAKWQKGFGYLPFRVHFEASMYEKVFEEEIFIIFHWT